MFHVVVIGAGTMASVHSQAYSNMDNVKLAGIVDIRKDKAEELASRLGAQAFESLDEALQALGRVDIIDVCVPTYLHKDYVLKAASLGKHVVCEKPLARNLEEAEEMIRVCKENGVRLFVGHVLRFFPEYTKAKALVDGGVIGDAAVIRTSRGGSFPVAWNNWYADINKSGGLLLDLIIHDIDFLRWVFGDVERVYAKGLMGREFEQSMDYALVTLRFRNGAIAHLEGSWAHTSFSMKFEIAGKTGVIDYDSSKDTPLASFSRSSSGGSAGVAVPESPLQENPYFRELKHFISCIEGAQSLVTAEDAYEAMRISLAAIESVQTGKPVTLQSGKGTLV